MIELLHNNPHSLKKFKNLFLNLHKVYQFFFNSRKFSNNPKNVGDPKSVFEIGESSENQVSLHQNCF